MRRVVTVDFQGRGDPSYHRRLQLLWRWNKGLIVKQASAILDTHLVPRESIAIYRAIMEAAAMVNFPYDDRGDWIK